MEEKERPKKTAVALRYEPSLDTAPKVVATGKGFLAERIISVAKEHQIPIQQNKTVVNMLEKLELGDEIPPELYQIVAEVMAFVYRLDQKAGLK